MDLFEQSCAFYDVIVLQTVLEELKNRSLPLYNRIMALAKSEEKRFYFFFNEFRLETHVRREQGRASTIEMTEQFVKPPDGIQNICLDRSVQLSSFLLMIKQICERPRSRASLQYRLQSM